jgi:GlpG protein
MIRLITLDNPRMGQAFIDYLATRKIEAQMMPENGDQFVVWLLSDEDRIEAEAELKQFLAEPHHPRYQASSWDMAESRKNPFRYNTPSLLNLLKAKAGPLTLLVMLISCVIFVLQTVGLGQVIFESLHFPALDGQQWQVWRWFTHAFLHFSVLHIVFNLLWWWQLGGDIEQKLGVRKLLEIFIISAAVSGTGQYWLAGANFGGLSGVVYALVGYLWILTWLRPEAGLSIPKPIVGFMLVWLVLGFVQPFMAIANMAHLAGLLSGVALGFVDGRKRLKAH